jgi:hypothetical protein
MNFEDLLKSLPVSDGNLKITSDGGLRYLSAAYTEFVAPTFREDTGKVAESTILVISAPGAVGKSTVAREIAFYGRAPFWDLAQESPVAGHSMGGAFMAAFGTLGVGEAMECLKNAKLFLVIDALDEARIKTTEAVFEAFIEDVAKFGKGTKGISFVLLGRTQVAEHVWLLLDEAGVSTALIEIESFDRDHSEEYIDKKVRASGDNVWARVSTHRGPFENVRDLIFERLAYAINGTKDMGALTSAAKDFLGYAPVLDAISVLLAGTTNFEELKVQITQEFEASITSTRYAAAMLLRKIIEAILSREHKQKLVHNIKPAIEDVAKQIPWNSWDSLYTPEEQSERILARITNTDYHQEHSLLPPRLLAAYEDQLSHWLSEHPFLRDGLVPANVVFESYLLARALVHGSVSTQGSAEWFVRQKHYKPSNLLAEFYLLFVGNDQDHTVPAEHIGILYESMLSGETETRRLRIILEGPETVEEGVTAEGDLEFLHWKDDGSYEIVSSSSFLTELKRSSNISFNRSLREATIVVPCEIHLGSDGAEFLIGPNVSVRANCLLFNCRRLIVDTKQRRHNGDDGSVIIEANECKSSLVDRPTVRGEFQVSWPGSEAFPWNEFHTSEPGSSYDTPALQQTYRRFRRIIMTLRSHSRGGLARYRDKLEHQRVLQGDLGVALLRRLTRDGILSLKDNFYYWQSDKAKDLVGISWTDLRKGITTDSLTQYLRSFIQDNSKFS